MRNPNIKYLRFELPKDTWELFALICHDQNVYPGAVFRMFAEKIIEGRLAIPADVRKKPPSGSGRPLKPEKRKRSASA